ncbi:MAG TPA: hypothetical protein VLX28_08100 [Thermoanaerobaculia bacterium]|nr:hypothetical protein [Thermoanaerobaculia bacterium]
MQMVSPAISRPGDHTYRDPSGLTSRTDLGTQNAEVETPSPEPGDPSEP